MFQRIFFFLSILIIRSEATSTRGEALLGILRMDLPLELGYHEVKVARNV